MSRLLKRNDALFGELADEESAKIKDAEEFVLQSARGGQRTNTSDY